MSSQFGILPKEVLIKIAGELSLKDLLNFCTTNRYLSSLLCDDYLWQILFKRNLGETAEKIRPTWKETYRSVVTARVSVFGYIGKSQLCLPLPLMYEYSPQRIPVPAEVRFIKTISVSAGGLFSAILDIDRNVFIFGRNWRIEPMPEIKGARAISAGGSHVMAIGPDHSVWVFGKNNEGQLGLGGPDEVEQTNGTSWIFGRKIGSSESQGQTFISEPTQIPNLKAKVISAGGNHSALIDLDHSVVWTFGSNRSGQLGRSDTFIVGSPKPIPGITAVDVSAGGYHTLILDNEGNVWAFGNNECGQLGLGDTVDRCVPTKIPGLKAIKVSAGYDFSLVIDTEHRLLSFGNAISGQLGRDTTVVPPEIPGIVPGLIVADISAGESHAIVLTTDNRVFTFGENEYGQLGVGDNLFRDSPVLVDGVHATTSLPLKTISAGYYHSMVISVR